MTVCHSIKLNVTQFWKSLLLSFFQLLFISLFLLNLFAVDVGAVVVVDHLVLCRYGNEKRKTRKHETLKHETGIQVVKIYVLSTVLRKPHANHINRHRHEFRYKFSHLKFRSETILRSFIRYAVKSYTMESIVRTFVVKFSNVFFFFFFLFYFSTFIEFGPTTATKRIRFSH